jgi:hypothetical protein
MPYIDEYYAQRAQPDPDIPQPMGYQPDASAITGAGRADIAPAGAAGWRERTEDWINRNLLSGGVTDIRNLATAVGPAVQAAGGLGQVLSWGSRAGMPAKAQPAVDAADQMFDVAQQSPIMRAAMGQGGFIDPRVAAMLAVGAGITGVGGYAAWKVKEMMDARQAALEAAMKQAR